jgi:hypothetical protein
MTAVPEDFVTSSCIGRDVHFGGELGNQLFQIAAVLGYAERHGVRPLFHPWRCAFSGRDYGRLFPALEQRDGLRPEQVFEQRSFRHGPIPRRHRCDLRGMFQSEKFFPENRERLREIFAAPPAIAARVDEVVRAHGLGEFSALHLRYYDRPVRDQTPVLHTLPDHYHLAALERMGRDLPVAVVTNNPARAGLLARRHLGGVRHVVLSAPDPLVDFYLLARAARLGISNSSFGWWAGWLNRTAPTVHAPDRRKWFSFLARADPYWDTADLYGPRFTEVAF